MDNNTNDFRVKKLLIEEAKLWKADDGSRNWLNFGRVIDVKPLIAADATGVGTEGSVYVPSKNLTTITAAVRKVPISPATLNGYSACSDCKEHSGASTVMVISANAPLRDVIALGRDAALNNSANASPREVYISLHIYRFVYKDIYINI
jgi:hypothetical protein